MIPIAFTTLFMANPKKRDWGCRNMGDKWKANGAG